MKEMGKKKSMKDLNKVKFNAFDGDDIQVTQGNE